MARRLLTLIVVLAACVALATGPCGADAHSASNEIAVNGRAASFAASNSSLLTHGARMALLERDAAVASHLAAHAAMADLQQQIGFDFLKSLLPKVDLGAVLNAPVCLLSQAFGAMPKIKSPDPAKCKPGLKEMKVRIELKLFAFTLDLDNALEFCGVVEVLKDALTTVEQAMKNQAPNCLTKENLIALAGQLRDGLSAVAAQSAGGSGDDGEGQDSGSGSGSTPAEFVELGAGAWQIPEHLGVEYQSDPAYHFMDPRAHELFLLEAGAEINAQKVLGMIRSVLTFLQKLVHRLEAAHVECAAWGVSFPMKTVIGLPPVAKLHISDFTTVCAMYKELPNLGKDLAAQADSSDVKDIIKGAGKQLGKAAGAIGKKLGLKKFKRGRFRFAEANSSPSLDPSQHRDQEEEEMVEYDLPADVLTAGAHALLPDSADPSFVEAATFLLAGPHANMLHRVSSFLETSTEAHASLRAHLTAHQHALARAVLQAKGIVATLVNAMQPALALPFRILQKFHNADGTCTLMVPHAQKFSEDSLKKFNAGFAINLELKLPIELPAIDWQVDNAFSLCLLISGVQSIVESATTGEAAAILQSQVGKLPGANVAKKLGKFGKRFKRFRQVHPALSVGVAARTDSTLLQSLLQAVHAQPAPAGPAGVSLLEEQAQFPGLSKIFDKIKGLMAAPVTYFAKVLSLIEKATGDCDRAFGVIEGAIDSAGAGDLVSSLNVPIHAEFQLPPAPVQPLVRLWVKDSKSLCTIAMCLRRLKDDTDLFAEGSSSGSGSDSEASGQDVDGNGEGEGDQQQDQQ